jgi:hypothetical protein
VVTRRKQVDDEDVDPLSERRNHLLDEVVHRLGAVLVRGRDDLDESDDAAARAMPDRQRSARKTAGRFFGRLHGDADLRRSFSDRQGTLGNRAERRPRLDRQGEDVGVGLAIVLLRERVVAFGQDSGVEGFLEVGHPRDLEVVKRSCGDAGPVVYRHRRARSADLTFSRSSYRESTTVHGRNHAVVLPRRFDLVRGDTENVSHASESTR